LRSAYCLGHTPADPIGVYTFRMRKRCACAVGVGVSFTPRSTVFIGRSRPQTPERMRPLIIVSTRAFDDLFLFRRVDEDSLTFTRPTFT